MRKVSGAFWKSLAIASFVAGGVGTAYASDVALPPGPYFGLGAGISQPQYGHFNTYDFNAGTVAPGSAHFDLGWGIVGAAGYKWNNGLRAELELGYRRADPHLLDGAVVSGSTETTSVMGNLLYDINTRAGITPYFGGGVGMGEQHWDNVHDATYANSAHMRDTGFQWQAIGGVAMPVDRHFSLFAEYRYIGLNDLRFNQRFFDNISPVGHYTDHSHNVLVGFRWHPGATSDVNSRQMY